MIKVIAFDLDGLLIDSELIWFQTISEIHTENGYQWNEEDQRDFSGRSTKKVSEIISTKLIKTTQKDVYFQIIKKMRAKLERSIPLMPGATEILNLFKDYPLALVSSSPLELISFVKQKLKWENHFSLFLSGSDFEKGKPAPDIYISVCNFFNIHPGNLLVFEDSTNGILAACNAKAKVIAIPNNHFSIPPEILTKADVVLHSLNDFSLMIISNL